MANKFTRFLTGVGDGLLTPKGVVANWRHATRLFVDDTMRLAPRTKFMYYVRFELDKTVIKAPQFSAKYADEIGYLIKSTDLPKFTMEAVTKNQYNRKHVIYKNFSYDPLNMVFHDDNQGIINALWAIYFGYYAADRNLPDQAFSKSVSTYRSTGTGFDNFRYGLDNNKSADIFKSISIYTMSRSRFNGYTLVNPKITSWSHGSVASDANEFLDNQMTVAYESVVYSSGKVGFDSPKGFAMLHYDTIPSPLSVAGGGVSTLFGEAGVLAGAEQIFGAIGDGTAFGSVGGFLGTAISAVNTAKNLGKLTGAGIRNEAVNLLSSPATIAGIVGTVGGVVGSVFPKNSGSQDTTQAAPKVLAGDADINGLA